MNQEEKERDYVNISLHKDVVKNIKLLIIDPALDYKNVSEYVHDACRRRKEQLLSLYPHLKEKFDS